jgi:hypothetical protein
MGQIDGSRIGRWLDGEVGMGEALGLSIDAEALRRQAAALYAAGKWSECIVAVDAATTAGGQGPYDALMLCRCYDEIGEPGIAEAWASVANESLAAIDRVLGGRR